VQAASRPDVDAIFGIPPTVAIEQRTSRGGRKSTVGTLTEVHPIPAAAGFVKSVRSTADSTSRSNRKART
jgi:excinuclease UvrABC ATPase subunit